LFITCLVDVMRPEIAEASVRLLESAGCTVEVPMAQTCCGQPGYNSGDSVAARDLARKFLGEFEGFDYVVVPSGSCGGMVRQHYPALFADDPDLNNRIDALAQKTFELTAFLMTSSVSARCPVALPARSPITIHAAACANSACRLSRARYSRSIRRSVSPR